MSEYYFWTSRVYLRADAEKRMTEVAPRIVGFCREHGDDYPDYKDDLAPFEMTLDSLLSDFNLELTECRDPKDGHFFMSTGDAFYMEPFDSLLRLIAPLFKDGSEIILQESEDHDCLFEYKLIKGKWLYRNTWKPVFSGAWKPI